ncbi:MAG: nitrophenyl compound nitroreductase subunit ArsF family protein [Victivallaceae bacterium]|nr:nitrophenyl compound nitroreductase subunit ArsF family protein [Victivallaceae bacterium]
MKIQVYGSGCDKCKKLTANVQTAAKHLGVEIELEKVTQINAITEAGILMTPALAIDGKLVSSGKVLSEAEVAKILTAPPPCACNGACGPSGEKAPSTKTCCSASAPASACGCSGGASAGACCEKGNSLKKILTFALLVFVAASIAVMIIQQKKAQNSTAANGKTQVASSDTPKHDNEILVFYFHGNQRCFTCNKIETLTKQALEEKYSKELADGRIVFRPVNVEDPVNEHFVNDFQLSSRSVVMQKNGKYQKFDAVWTLVREPQKFTEYIQNGVTEMLQ